jgi:glycosyltransferase involved in cell wall biosynthesis
MIVKNEEENLRACLESAADLADEIIIVDTGSTDRTIEIASEYTRKIFNFEWVDDFSAARNFSYSKATKDYIFWLDADDIITEPNRKKFLQLKNEMYKNSVDVVLMKYEYFRSPDNELFMQTRERLSINDPKIRWCEHIHETLDLDVEGLSILIADISITHTLKDLKDSSSRNFRILTDLILRNKASAREKFYYGLMLAISNKYEEAKKYLEESIESQASLDILRGILYLHKIYLTEEENDKALRILADHQESLDDMSELHCAFGDYYKDLKEDYKTAITHYEKAMSCTGYTNGMPGYTNSQFYYFIPLKSLGFCQIKENRYSDALDSYRKARVYDRKDETLKQLVNTLEKLISATSFENSA